MPNLRSLHFDVQVISRGHGKSSVASASYRSGKKLKAGTPIRSALAAASYRSGETLYDEREQRTFDYSRKEDIRHSEIIAPVNAPGWVQNRQTLWNRVEAVEKRKDAQLARDVIAVFPRELTLEECKTMIREYVNDNFVSKGMVADFSIHEASASDGGKNTHAHIMLTMREIGTDGFGKKNRQWNDQKLVTKWRDSWERYSNQYLELAGHEVRVTLQSYEHLGIDKRPGVHMGAEQWNLEQKQHETQRGNQNRKITHENIVNEIVKSDDPEQDIEETLEAEPVEEQKIEPKAENENHPLARFIENEGEATNRMAAESRELKDWSSEQPASVAENRASVAVAPHTSSASGNIADIEAARASHEALLREHLQAKESTTATERVAVSLAVKDYVKRFTKRAKDIGRSAFEQFRNLLKETERLKQEERDHER